MTFKLDHNNYNVRDMEASLKFYEEALGLKPVREKAARDGAYRIVYLGDGRSEFSLELTWLREHEGAYDLGEEEFHLGFTADDYDAALRLHSEMGCVCFVNEEMRVYFINDPDGYWLEIKPAK
jgi:lactoylglutathione lyase